MAKKKDKSDKKEPAVIDTQSGKKKKKPEKKSSITKKAEKLVRSKKVAVSPEVAILEASAILNTDNISLRAYFIGEQRLREGRDGDSHGDWVEAERQLHEEHKTKKKR
ncbi:MAG: hypothetical protein ABI443_07005 [Chthoniobacterales bacterium]